MLHEYAVEPELVATWGDRKSGRYFLDKFGLGSPRIMSRYPRKRWKRLVWEAWESNSHDDSERKRMEELIQRLSEDMVTRRNAVWNPDGTWSRNVLDEHRRIPFHAILARNNAGAHPNILVADEVDERTALWAVPHETVLRTPTAIAGVVRDMLRMATDIIFVDPYFGPQARYATVLAACLRACLYKRVGCEQPSVRIFAAADKTGTREHFENECRATLPQLLPQGQRVIISRLKERSEGEKLHNRYVLTEFGGVGFPAGLDKKRGATDDPWLLTRRQYEKRWPQYAGKQPAFDRPEGEITIVGTERR